MNTLFWVTLNVLGFIILFFMFNKRAKGSEENLESSVTQVLFKYFLWTIIIYIFADTAAYILEGTSFKWAWYLNYIFNIITYIAIPIFIVIYLIYCDEKTFYNKRNVKKRVICYFVPIIIYTIAVIFSSFSNIFFYIDENNNYRQGAFFPVFIAIKFIYITAIYLMLTLRLRGKKAVAPKGKNLYLYLLPIPSVFLSVVQVLYSDGPVVGIGFVLSAFIWYINGIQSPEDRRSIAVRCYNLNIIQFAVISFIMMASMLLVFENTTDKVTNDNTIYNSTTLLFIIMAVILVLFAYTSNRITTKLIFMPLKELINSLLLMRKNNEQKIYGLERSDEIGLLSNAIQDYFVKGYFDELTGIYNRRYLDTTLRQIMVNYSRTEYKLSILMLDIDFFKKYNDLYGHSQGDICLKLIAEKLNNLIRRKGDFIARYGGEEFAVVLPCTDEEGARGLAETMLKAIRDLNIPHEQSECGIVTISIGVTTGFNVYGTNHENYIKKADEALYLSKANGRNGYTFLPLT